MRRLRNARPIAMIFGKRYLYLGGAKLTKGTKTAKMMIQSERIYQSILSQLSLVPVDSLQQIDAFLQSITKEMRQKEQTRALILNLAGSWSDMPETDFNDFVAHYKKESNEMFSREIDL